MLKNPSPVKTNVMSHKPNNHVRKVIAPSVIRALLGEMWDRNMIWNLIWSHFKRSKSI